MNDSIPFFCFEFVDLSFRVDDLSPRIKYKKKST